MVHCVGITVSKQALHSLLVGTHVSTAPLEGNVAAYIKVTDAHVL